MAPELRHPRRPQAASEYLLERWGVRATVATLAKYRCLGCGPAFRKIQRDVIYDEPALDQWAAGRVSATEFQSTAEVAGTS